MAVESSPSVFVIHAVTDAPQEFIYRVDRLINILGNFYPMLNWEPGIGNSVYERDLDRATHAGLVVADCSYPSTGMGMEMQERLRLGKPLLAVIEEGKLAPSIVQSINRSNFKLQTYQQIDEVATMVDNHFEFREV